MADRWYPYCVVATLGSMIYPNLVPLSKAHLRHLALCQSLSDHDAFPASPTGKHCPGFHATDHLS